MSRLMELKDSSPKSGHSHLAIVRNPEDKEISEDDDDDRNHKHRRREAHSQYPEGDSSHQILTRPYRMRNQTFGNGYPFREGGFNSNETWKNYDDATQEDAFSGCFDNRRLYVPSFSRVMLDVNQRNRINRSMSADPGSAKLKSRDSVIWSQPESKFRQLDIAAQLVQGSVPPILFSSRGLPAVSNVPSTSWNVLGLIPGIPSGDLDTLKSVGLQGSLRPPFLPSQGIGFPRQQCRDFEERGFCLRGDMCPMEHGVNRIVIDDVQSLSHFNLPVVPVLGTTAARRPLPANASISTFMYSKGLQIKNSKHGMNDGGMDLDSGFVGYSVAGVADVYDPDQPLLTDNCPETSPAIVSVNGPHFNENDPLIMQDTSNQHIVALSDGTPNDIPRTNARTTAASQSSSVWERIGGSKSSNLEVSNTDSTFISSTNLENEVKKQTDLIEISKGCVNQDREMNADNVGSHSVLSSKPISDPGCSFKRPYQKASRTLFVSGIPPKENIREALLSHFKKFGKVIDIHIPSDSGKAFVQFFRREEAEAAFKAPDAVMGNRFIKLRWANRDNIPDDRNGGHSNPADNTKGVTVALGPPSLPNSAKGPPILTISAKGHGTVQTPAKKGSVSNVSVTSLLTSVVPKPIINSPKSASTSQKKLEDLELMKKELRKKQEILEQKRNEFRRQLDKLKKQATGLKDEGGSNPPSKRHKSGALVDVPKIEVSKSAPDSVCLSSPQPQKINGSASFGGNAVTQCNKSISNPAVLESCSLKPSIRPFAPPFVDKYKLDNRPAIFTVLPPLPAGLATVSALKEHFSIYGELSVVESDTFKHKDGSCEVETLKMSARIAYTSRRSAEKAFLNGKCWQGHELKFVWGSTGKISKETGAKENPSLSAEKSLDADVQSAGEVSTTGGPENLKSENLNRQEHNLSQVGDQAEILKSDKEGKSPEL